MSVFCINIIIIIITPVKKKIVSYIMVRHELRYVFADLEKDRLRFSRCFKIQ